MLYLLHQAADLASVEEKILPRLEEWGYELIPFPPDETFQPVQNGVLLLYLGDEQLRLILPKAAEEKWPVAILPHSENEYTSKGLGISGDLKETLEEVLEDKQSEELDMLFCNGKAVFRSINVGNIFALTAKESQSNFFSEVYHILKRIYRLSLLSHLSFEISADEEKIIHTSALGIIIVEHSSSSLIARRLVQQSSTNDGTFYAIILAPQNLLVLLWFFLRSFWPQKKKLRKVPSFVGSIQTSNLRITNSIPFEYSVDGQEETSGEISLELRPKALLLRQKSIYNKENSEENGKKSLKIEGLPTGEKRDELSKRRLPILPRATAEEFQDLFQVLRENAQTTSAFMIMMVLSTLIAAFGLFGNSSPVIIGAMILAPIIAPIVSFAMGMVRYDLSMLKTSLRTIAAGTAVSLSFAAFVSIIIPLEIITPEIEARLSPTLLDMGIAVASGIAAAYANAKEGIARSLAGVAIAVALVPPLAVAGIGIGWWDWQVFSGAFLLYLTNLSGIIMFAGLTFLLLGFAPFKRARMGLVYTFLILILVAVPLSLSFDRIIQEASITRALEGTTIENTVLRDVKIRFGKPIVLSLRLVGPEAMESQKIQKIKEEIEKRLEHPVILEVVSAIEF